MTTEREVWDLIQGVENELTNLKTAHQRPLGALDFFKKIQSLTVILQNPYGTYYKDFWVDVKIEKPEVTPPIVQSGWDLPSGFLYIDLYEYAVSFDYSTFSYRLALQSENISSATFNFSALSSQPIKSIGVRV